MGTYNILKTKIKCPRCKQVTDQEVDLHLGYTNEMLEFNLGGKYLWFFGKDFKNGGRPENGDIDGEGYAVCELCRRDFFVSVKVRNDVIEGVEYDSTKKPFLKD
ncbi:MAG: hypothetical protein ACR2F2_02105 [Pyrinomonadaceae bacterium]